MHSPEESEMHRKCFKASDRYIKRSLRRLEGVVRIRYSCGRVRSDSQRFARVTRENSGFEALRVACFKTGPTYQMANHFAVLPYADARLGTVGRLHATASPCEPLKCIGRANMMSEKQWRNARRASIDSGAPDAHRDLRRGRHAYPYIG